MSAPERILEPEWLDQLAPADRRARRSRADLRRINLLMRNARLLSRELAARLPQARRVRIADLGSGDGSMMLHVARQLKRANVEVSLVDRAPAVAPEVLAGFRQIQWNLKNTAADVFEFLLQPGPRFDAIVVNLFLHHFERQRLEALLSLSAGRTALLVACEPRRSAFALNASRLLWLLGCNDVTRHDAVASVRAGFRANELSQAWPKSAGWKLHERAARPFSHLFVAERPMDAAEPRGDL